MSDIRNVRTEQAIVDALLVLLESKPLADISVQELSKAAHVSRSTFYAHFANTGAVFFRAVHQFILQTRELKTQLKCESCLEDAPGTPFCIQLREKGAYAALVREPLFLPYYLALMSETAGFSLQKSLEKAGLDSEIAAAVLRFQMTGCYNVAMTMRDNAEWPRVQAALDTFIQGGLNALRASC